MTRSRDIGEDALIERLLGQLPACPGLAGSGPGDDCAVAETRDGTLQLLKTDALVSGVHFEALTPGHDVGWKAIARVTSDMAAMGGRPERFLATLAVPGDTPVEWLESLYRGFGECLGRHGGTLVGGETSRVPDGSAAVISIAATGSVRREQLVLRSGGRPGDALLCTGTLGGSIAGKHLRFVPRVEEAAWLVSHYTPHAMMDLSDGLAKDLPRLAGASACGFTIDRDSLPRTPGCTVDQALGDGEDYELLFAIDAGTAPALLDAWKTAFPDLPLTRIGSLCDAGEGDSLTGGWDHFA